MTSAAGSSAADAVRWDAGRYGANLAHHRAHDAALLDPLALAGDERVLDLGCGVGDLSAALAAGLPRGEVVAVDADPDMVRRAAARETSNLRVRRVRAQDVGTAFAPASFDVVLSVAVLHWVPEAAQPAVAAGVRRVLRRGGRLRADFGGHGQIAHARGLLDALVARHGGGPAPWYFPTAAAYAELLHDAGLSTENGWVRTVQQRRPFDESGVRGWLASQVAIAYLPSVPASARAAFLDDIGHEVVPALRRADGTFDQDYVRIDVLATVR